MSQKTDDRVMVEMEMRFEQVVTVKMPMHAPPGTLETALDAWWNIDPDGGIDALRGDSKQFWECIGIEVHDQ